MSRTSSGLTAASASLRPAAAGELRPAAEIYGISDAELDGRMHPLLRLADVDAVRRTARALADLQLLHDEDRRQIWIAETEGTVTGFAAAAFRGRHAHIQYLFVAPDAQERGIGGALLGRLHDAGRDAGCTVFTLQASDDPRALTRYYRLGLVPLAPNVVWSAPDSSFSLPCPSNRFESVPLCIEDEAALNTVADIDKAVRGVRRPRDLRRWLHEGETGAILTDRETGRPAGYFLCATDGEHGRIGPVAAMDRERFVEILQNAFAAAAARHTPGATWKVAIPGENREAIAPLLAAGFRPDYTTTFFASQPIGRFDRYLFHDLDLL